MKENFLTREGATELRERLTELKNVRRREIAEAIQAAKEQGDLSENAEYQQAKDEQRRIEEQISELEGALKHAQIITKASSDEVTVGNFVTLGCEDGKTKEYQIVGSNEANPLEGKISNESPMGHALLGAKKGDTVSIPTPIGNKECVVKKIS